MSKNHTKLISDEGYSSPYIISLLSKNKDSDNDKISKIRYQVEQYFGKLKKFQAASTPFRLGVTLQVCSLNIIYNLIEIDKNF